MRDHRNSVVAFLVVASIGLAAASTVQHQAGGEPMEITGSPDQQGVERLIADWPEASKSAVRTMLDKYGPPDEATPRMVLWRDNSPWKRTVVHRDETRHLFPRKHADVLEQTITYRIPVEKVDELAQFDGSIIADRTRGELTSRNDREEMNFLALNLADEVLRGKKSVARARREYGRTAFSSLAGKASEYVSGLKFAAGEGATADPDKPILEEILE